MILFHVGLSLFSDRLQGRNSNIKNPSSVDIQIQKREKGKKKRENYLGKKKIR